MRILLYSPDNGVTRNFMPHLWMFLLQTLTPPGHEVLLIDGNARPIDEAAMTQFVQEQKIGLVGIGAMTRMVAKAYRMADAVRAAGVPVVMGGPHVTENPTKRLAEVADRGMPTQLPWGKPMKRGPRLLRTPRVANSGKSMNPGMSLGRNENPHCNPIRRFPGNP